MRLLDICSTHAILVPDIYALADSRSVWIFIRSPRQFRFACQVISFFCPIFMVLQSLASYACWIERQAAILHSRHDGHRHSR